MKVAEYAGGTGPAFECGIAITFKLTRYTTGQGRDNFGLTKYFIPAENLVKEKR